MSTQYLYAIGDHYCAAAYANTPYMAALEDPALVYRGRLPHPDNIKVSWQSNLARSLGLGIHTDAQAHRTPGTIVEVAKKAVLVRNDIKIMIVSWPIGWPILGAVNNEEDQIIDICSKRGIFYYGFHVQDMIDHLIKNGCAPVKDNHFGKDGHSLWAKYILQDLLTKGYS